LKRSSPIDDEFFAAMSDEFLTAAQSRCVLTGYQDANYLDALAAVHFRRGELAAAIHWQTLAVQFAKDRDLAEFEKTLGSYQSASGATSAEAPGGTEPVP
jgi:hypothetical protein